MTKKEKKLNSNLLALGKNSVIEILQSSFFKFKKIIVEKTTKNIENKKLWDLIYKNNINYELLNKESFNKYYFDKKNQGMVLFIKEYNYYNLENLFFRKNNKQKIIVALDSIEDPHNMGAIIRTCASLSIDALIINKRNQVPVNNTVIKVSSGGIAHIPIVLSNNLNQTIQDLKKNNYNIISTVCNESSLPLNKLDIKSLVSNKNKDICLIFGNENKGVSQELIHLSNLSINIPILNQMNSFNISVSCGIICAWFKLN